MAMDARILHEASKEESVETPVQVELHVGICMATKRMTEEFE